MLLYGTGFCNAGITDIFKGKIVRIPDGAGLKIPHMGWNSLDVKKDATLFKGLPENPYVYFVHSFCAKNCEDSLAAVTEYGMEVTAAVEKENIYGCQFHPEKSGEAGLKILKAFCYGKA